MTNEEIILETFYVKKKKTDSFDNFLYFSKSGINFFKK